MSKRLYEAMFVLDSEKGGDGLPSLIQHISDLLARNDAEIERIEEWDERKLAYKISGADRGIYMQVHFRAEPDQVQELRTAINLSEDILRVLLLSADEIPPAVGQLYNAEGEEIEAPEADEEELPEEAEDTENTEESDEGGE